ncbi:CRTAC1 family protein [Akkermansiaceae bacterium]|nr:CRTAC1 family protein [Akkermansiaceae bacterium]
MATPLKVCSLLILISFVSCKSDSESTEESSLGISARFPDHTELLATDLKKPSEAPETKTLFESIDATAAGMDFVHRWELNKKTVKLFDRIEAGGGVTIGDVDGDGLPDVFLTRPLDGARLYRNLGGFKFEDITNSAGLEQPNDQWPTGASFADIDNDGDLDLAICGFDCPTQLYINDGKGVFSDQAAELGFDFKGAGIMVAFSDYDRDGDLDAFLATHRYAVDLLDPRYDQGNFVVGFMFPALAQASPSFGLQFCDANTDGFPDLYLVQNFFGPQPETGRMHSGLSLLLTGKGDGEFVPVWPEESGLIVSGDAKGLVSLASGEFLVSQNNDSASSFRQTKGPSKPCVLHLIGKGKNTEAIGARVSCSIENKPAGEFEIYAGSGYLSSSSRAFSVPTGSGDKLDLQIRWPDGSESQHSVSPHGDHTIRQR